MAESLLYKLHSAGIVEDVAMPTHFEEVYTSKNQMVRIWKVKDPSQESKDFCKYYRRYPPALNDVRGCACCAVQMVADMKLMP